MEKFKKSIYAEFKEKQSKEINRFPMFFAFSKEQFEQGLKKLGIVNLSDCLSIGAGGYIKKEDSKKLIDLYKKLDAELTEFLSSYENLQDAFLHELGNNEFIITYDYFDTLNSLGLKYENLTEIQLLALKEAKKDYLKWQEIWG